MQKPFPFLPSCVSQQAQNEDAYGDLRKAGCNDHKHHVQSIELDLFHEMLFDIIDMSAVA